MRNSTNMTASDCFYLGTESYKNDETACAIMWLREALRRFDVDNDDAKLEASIKGHLSVILYENGNMQVEICKFLRIFKQ